MKIDLPELDDVFCAFFTNAFSLTFIGREKL